MNARTSRHTRILNKLKTNIKTKAYIAYLWASLVLDAFTNIPVVFVFVCVSIVNKFKLF